MMGIEAENIKISKTLTRAVGTYGAESWTFSKILLNGGVPLKVRF
jgi:hypothetical protein